MGIQWRRQINSRDLGLIECLKNDAWKAGQMAPRSKIRRSEELWIEVHKNFSGGSDQNHPPKKEVVVRGGLTKS